MPAAVPLAIDSGMTSSTAHAVANTTVPGSIHHVVDPADRQLAREDGDGDQADLDGGPAGKRGSRGEGDRHGERRKGVRGQHE